MGCHDRPNWSVIGLTYDLQARQGLAAGLPWASADTAARRRDMTTDLQREDVGVPLGVHDPF